MDPIWASIAEFWWVAPTAVGAGTLGWIGLRHQRAENARRLEYDAARDDLRTARRSISGSRAAVKVARAELARLQAERTAGRATSAEVAAARRQYDAAQREAKASGAAVRSHRAQVAAARAALPASAADPAQLPLPRLVAAHDAIDARWMEYETDPARLIAFPVMSDGRQPLTAAFLAQRAEAVRLRPTGAKVRVTPAQYSAYRDAVRRLERAFDAAEQEAWRQARAAGTVPRDLPDPSAGGSPAPAWADIAQSFAQTMLTRSTEAIARVTESAKTRMDAGSAPQPDATADRPRDPHAPGDETTNRPPTAPASPSSSTTDPTRPRVWPVPSRTRRPPGS